MAGRVLRNSKGQFNGSTAGWGAGKRTARRAVNGARARTAAYNGKVIRQEVVVGNKKLNGAKAGVYSHGLTRSENRARVKAEYTQRGIYGAASMAAPRGIRRTVNTVGYMRGQTKRRAVMNAQHRAAFESGKLVKINASQAKSIRRANTRRVLKKHVGQRILTTAASNHGRALMGASLAAAGGLAGAHYARNSSIPLNRTLGAGMKVASRNRAGVYNVTSMGQAGRMSRAARVRLGGQRMTAALRFAANAG